MNSNRSLSGKEADEANYTTRGGDLCPVCGQTAQPRAVLDDYQLFHCEECGCWSSDALERRASLSFENPDYFANALLDRPKWDALFDRLEGAGRTVGSLLDVGCGTGAFLEHVGATRPSVRREGIELDPERASEAQTRNPSAAIHVGAASDVLGASGGPFDLITLWDVFEHVPAPTDLLTELAASLTPNGAIHIVTIHEDSLVPAIGRLSYELSGGRVTYPLRRTHEPHHLVFFSRDGIRLSADRAGLRIDRLWHDRLARGRMDGPAWLTAVTSLVLSAENALGNGLFVNLILERKPDSI